MPLHAQEQIFVQVPHLETSHLAAVRLLHHVHDCPQYCHPHDEGKSCYFLYSVLWTLEDGRNTDVE